MVTPDLEACNGVVHTVDNVLLPFDGKASGAASATSACPPTSFTRVRQLDTPHNTGGMAIVCLYTRKRLSLSLV